MFLRKDSLSEIILRELEEFSLRRRLVFYPKTDIQISEDELRSIPLLKEREAALHQQFVMEICSMFFRRTPVAVLPLKKGTFHLLYKIVFPNNECYIVRTSISRSPNRAFEFLIDSWIVEVLKQEEVPAIPVYCIDLSRAVYPFDYEIIAEVPGAELTVFEDKDTQYIDPYLLFELGQLVAKIHNVEATGFGLLDIKSILSKQNPQGKGLLQTWEDYILLNMETHLQTCMNIGAINQEECRTIAKAFESIYRISRDVRASLLHGDLGHHNVFSDGQHITAIIDWEDCLCGDPVFDIAFWGTFCRDYMLDPFLKGYRTIRQLPGDFELRYWLYYLRIALSKTVHRFRFGYPDRPGRPPASLRIQKAVEKLRSLGCC